MAGPNRSVKAFALSILFILSGPLSQVMMANDSISELELSDDFSQTSTGITEVIIAGPNGNGVGPSLTMNPDHALQTISFSVAAGDEVRETGFNWSDWNEPGFSKLGLVEEDDGSLILGFQGITWDFDQGKNGWTSSNSNFGQRNSATTCGMSGGNGASWWTRGGAVSITSPQVNLAGHQGLAVQAWVKQGTYQCGEEPDTNENFYLEYKNSNNGWSQIQYLPGSTTGGTVTNVNYNLPSNAYHQDFQIRARQNSGSGSCCDYWFFDDVIIPGTTGANLTSPTFGWSSNSMEIIDEGRYPPMLIDAIIPSGAFLNWTVIDGDTNNPIPGLVNRIGKLVDLSAVDWKTHKSLKINLQFASSESGDSPRLYGISGGGKIHDSFNSNPEDSGWNLHNSTWDSSGLSISGDSTSTLISPEFDIDLPFTSFKFDSVIEGDVTTYVSLDRGNWSEFNSSSQRFDLERPSSVIQFKVEGLNGVWSLNNLRLQLYPSESVVSPRMDIDGDGIFEWGVTGEGIGSWGNQDVFIDGNISSTFEIGFNPTSWHYLLIPRNAKSFEVSVDDVGAVGLGVQTIALWVGNAMVAQTGGNGYVDGLRLSLNESELDLLNFETNNKAPTESMGGTDFIYSKIELISDAGTHRLGGLTITYDAEETVIATGIDEIVLSLNRARLNPSKATNIPLIFKADSSCSLEVSILSSTSSGDVTMGPLSWLNNSETLTPSHKWREMTTRAQVHASSPHRLIMNMYSDDSQAMWFIPLNFGNTVSVGNHDSLILSDEGLLHNISQDIHDLTTSFRTSQSFEDQEYLRLETRVELANGVISMPAIETWSSPAIDNDMQIESMEIFTDRGLVASDSTYLMAEDNLTFNIDIGFEDGEEDDKPYAGEFELQLFRNNELIANSTEYDGDFWIVESVAPFTSGNVSYEAILTPLTGGGSGDTMSINRTFVIDPLAPVVIGANIRFYDHLQSSTNQQIIVNITDQPVIPSEITLMLWTEWANDLDGNGWPSEGEYVPRPLTPPSDLEVTYGSYQTTIDDSSGYPGEKVAGYVTGTGQSGYEIVEGGSDLVDDHLFMYQILNDGVPLIDGDGFEWVGERRAWLHPGQSYGLNISFTELNGVSDVEQIKLSLADNIASDKLTIIWDSGVRNCVSESHHIVISSCKIVNSNGNTPNPYEQDLALYLEFIPQWTLPDLGDIRREPVVSMTDRSGNLDSVAFPQNRWRFSTEMMIPSNLSLWVENGALTEDGARVSPGSSMELSGEIMFTQSLDRPQFECDVEVRIDGVKTMASSSEGLFTAQVKASVKSGQHAMTWKVGCMPEQGIDTTSQFDAVKWILVDSIGPQVIEFSSPRQSSILELESHEVRVIISENYGIDASSVEMFWWITASSTNDKITSGNQMMTLDGEENEGLRLEFVGSVDLSGVSTEYLQEQVVLKMRFEGRDIAGNQFETTRNNENYPAGLWSLIHYTPDFKFEQSGIELSKSSLEVDEPTIVQIHVRNDGMLSGDANLLVEIVDLNGARSQLARTSLSVDANSVSTLVVDWKPTSPGIQRVEVTIGEDTDKSEFIDVKKTQEKSFLQDSIGSTSPWILGMTLAMVGVSLLVILAWMRLATLNNGDSDLEWEYEDEEEEDESEDSD